MNSRPLTLVALAAAVVIGLTGCGTSSAPQAGTGTSTSSVAPTHAAGGSPSAGAQIPGKPGTQVPNNSGGQVDSPPGGAETTQATVAPELPVTVAPAPEGSGQGLCFDLNSGLANSAVSRLAPPNWFIESASDDPIEAGCSGVLSWMTVKGYERYPYRHILFFTNGTYLGTATAEPYPYTRVLGKTRNTVSVEYKWAKPGDGLCCPSGGPSTVTFTLNGTSVQAQGQFPPDN
jgi:hypothetical protein